MRSRGITGLLVVLLLGSMLTMLMQPVAASAPDLVYVDDDYDSSTPGWGYDHFASVQDGIDAVAAGGIVHTYDGTYHEALHITKSLSLKAASSPIIEGSQLFATDYGNREAVIFVEDAESVVIEGLDVEGDGLGPGPIKSYGVLYQNSSGAIHDCIISPNTIGDMYSVGVAAISGSNLLLNHSLIENFGRIGVYATNVEKISIYDNEIVGQIYGADNLVNYGIEIEDYDGPSTAEIVGNEIYNSDNTNASVLWSSAAIIIDIWRGWYDLTPSNVSIEYNEIHDNYLAIEAVSNPNLHAHYNNIHGNRYGVYVDPDLYNNNETFDARFNWWGDASGPFHNNTNLIGLGTDVGDYVTYSPWFGFAAGAIPMTYHVNPTGMIQDAIDDANPGDTVKVHEGTYTEQLIIDKTLTLIGNPGPKIVAPDIRNTYTIPESSRTFDPIIFAYGGTESGGAVSGSGTISVSVSGFEIDGGNKAIASTFVGILYRNVNPGTISENTLHSLYDADGEGDGPETIGIIAYGDSDITIEGNVVSEFSRLGIGANGDFGPYPDPTAAIHNNTIMGNGLEPTTGWWAENGIQLSYDATGSITENHVSHCVVNNPSWASSGILPMAAGGAVIIQGNTVENCDVGIYLQDSASFLVVDGNTVTGATYEGITIWNYYWSVAHNITLSNNHITNNPTGIGIYDSSDNTIEGNVIENNDYGIYIDGNSNNTAILANEILNNNVDGIYIGPYGSYDPTGTEVHCNTIVGNGATGITKTGTAMVDATWNWWGSETGPYHSITNPSGTGDAVSDNVEYDPWKTHPDIKVEPSQVKAGMLNKTFEVNITISDLHENWQVVGVQMRVSFNATLLEVVNVAEGPFMQSSEWNAHGTYFIYYIEDESTLANGTVIPAHVVIGIVLMPNSTGQWTEFPHGSGTLATITFKTIYQEIGIENPPLTWNITAFDTMIVNPDQERLQHDIMQHCEYEMHPTNIADVNNDYYVGIDDVMLCAEAFGSSPTIHPDRWNPSCDINDDDYVGIDDIVTVASNFGWMPTYDP